MLKHTIFFMLFVSCTSVIAVDENKWLIYQPSATSTPVYIERVPKPPKNKIIEDKIEKRISAMRVQYGTATSTTISTKELEKKKKVVATPELAPMGTIRTIIGKHTCSSDGTSGVASFVMCNNEPETLIINSVLGRNFATHTSPTLPITLEINACSTFRITEGESLSFDCSGMFSISYHAYTDSYSAQGGVSATIVD